MLTLHEGAKMALRIGSVTIDSDNPRVMADFWSKALAYVISQENDDLAIAEDPNDTDVELVFVRVPEEKRVKNRVHLDLGADDMDSEVKRLESLGAAKVEIIRHWTVMRDPEGNEFCVVQASSEDPVESWRKKR